MNYHNAKQFSEKWGISERRIIKLCKDGRIDGAIKNGRQWLIPENTLKPSDKRANVSKYLDTKKRVLIINIEEKICEYLVPILQAEGYLVDGLYSEKKSIEALKNVSIFQFSDDEKRIDAIINKYYDGIIIIDLENNIGESKNYNKIINTISKKLYCNSPVLLVKAFSKKDNLKIDSKLIDEVEIRKNTLNIELPKNKKYLLDYENISKDINSLLTGFTNSSNNTINTNGTIIEFDKNGKSKLLKTGEYYKILNYYYSQLKKGDCFFLVSPMMESEWTETPLEMNFRLINLEAINRGAYIERIFLLKKEEIEKYKNNNTLKIFMQSNMKTLFVDYNEVMEKEPELINKIGCGIAEINKDVFLCDLPDDGEYRAYVSINKKEIEKNHEIYLQLKKYAVELKEVLKI